MAVRIGRRRTVGAFTTILARMWGAFSIVI
jgi:hypothetical protein